VVVLVFLSDAEVEVHDVQEIGLGQFDAFGLEVVGHVKHQAVSALAQTGVVVQQAVGVGRRVGSVKDVHLTQQHHRDTTAFALTHFGTQLDKKAFDIALWHMKAVLLRKLSI
jgi:hypothetical protein